MELDNEQKIIKILFKDFYNEYNSRNISKVIGISHAGAFKILKRLEKNGIVKPKKIGRAIIYSINKENPVAIREIEMALTLEAQNYRRWTEEFAELNKIAKFSVLFGSIIRNEKEARDIDLLVVSDKNKFEKIKKIIDSKNKILTKKIHLILQTVNEFALDMLKKNKVILEIVKTGIFLSGQEEIAKII